MNRTLELQQRKAALHDAAKALTDLAATEKRSLTQDELTTFDAKLKEAEGIDETIKREARLAGLAAAKDGGSRVEVSYGLAPSLDEHFRSNGMHPYGPEKRSGETAEDRKYRLHRGFGEQLQEVHHAAFNPHDVSTRLLAMNDWYKRSTPQGMSEQVPADGGFLVYPDFATEVLRIAHDTALVFSSGRNIPLSEATNAIKIPAVDEQSRKDGYRWGGVRAYWMNEADALTGSKPKFRLIELTTKKLGALYYATDELIQDAVALGSIITQAYGEEFGFKMDDAAINGDGAGKPLGILNSPALIVVPKTNGQSTLTLTFVNVVMMWFRLFARSRKTAVWYVNQDVEQQLMQMSLAVGTGGSSVVAGVAAFQGPQGVYTPAGFMGNATGMLFNRPVMPIEQCASLTSQGDIILADMSQWIYVDKGAPQQAVSMHVRFLTDEMTFRSIYRVDGQPWWHTPLTPFNGSNTVSPYVTLQAR
jgi:HK97 family phage major capsid protein